MRESTIRENKVLRLMYWFIEAMSYVVIVIRG